EDHGGECESGFESSHGTFSSQTTIALNRLGVRHRHWHCLARHRTAMRKHADRPFNHLSACSRMAVRCVHCTLRQLCTFKVFWNPSHPCRIPEIFSRAVPPYTC